MEGETVLSPAITILPTAKLLVYAESVMGFSLYKIPFTVSPYISQIQVSNWHRGCVPLFMDHTDQIPSLTFYDYKGFVIGAWARPESEKGSTSVGVVFTRDMFGSMIQVQRIEGKFFENKEQAEQHGVELCKDWIDKRHG
jgi:hypothetical protein